MQNKLSHPPSDSEQKECPYLLLIDDDQMVLDILQEILKPLKISIVCARSGEEAMNLFNKQQDQIKLVLLDLFLPDMNGIEIYKQIVEARSDIRIIFMSGFPNQDILKLRDLPGKFDYIQKPFSMREIKSRVHKIISELL
jgi:DNA-binding response OmpR family regulator